MNLELKGRYNAVMDPDSTQAGADPWHCDQDNDQIGADPWHCDQDNDQIGADPWHCDHWHI